MLYFIVYNLSFSQMRTKESTLKTITSSPSLTNCEKNDLYYSLYIYYKIENIKITECLFLFLVSKF